jgi:hypothetical protein
LGRLEGRKYARKLNTAAMALSARMRVDPIGRVSLAVDFIHNTIRAKWAPKELDAVSQFFFAYQDFMEKEGLKLQNLSRSSCGRADIWPLWCPHEGSLRRPSARSYPENPGLPWPAFQIPADRLGATGDSRPFVPSKMV